MVVSKIFVIVLTAEAIKYFTFFIVIWCVTGFN